MPDSSPPIRIGTTGRAVRKVGPNQSGIPFHTAAAGESGAEAFLSTSSWALPIFLDGGVTPGVSPSADFSKATNSSYVFFLEDI